MLMNGMLMGRGVVNEDFCHLLMGKRLPESQIFHAILIENNRTGAGEHSIHIYSHQKSWVFALAEFNWKNLSKGLIVSAHKLYDIC